MPFKSRNNNRILPPNSRTVDVAKQALRDLAPVQQRKYANAIEVNGYESVVYTKLTAGMKCSCQAHRKVFAPLLDEEGKLPVGTINKLVTGGLEFRVNRYGTQPQNRPDLRTERRGVDDGIDPFEAPRQEPLLPNGRRIVDVDYKTIDLDDEVATEQGVPGPATNGPVRVQTLEDMATDFDTEISLNDSACMVCYSTGYVGGYAVLGGWRENLSTQWPGAHIVGTIEGNKTPHAFYATNVTFTVTLPAGFVYLDAFRVWNNEDLVNPDSIQIDDLPFSTELFAALCDGREHTITVSFEDLTYWTHLEVQVCQTRSPAKIEFPKLTQGPSTQFEDSTEDVQINASPLVPHLARYSVIVESSFGKGFQVSSATYWNDAMRNVLGWDCNARAVQPSEIIGRLPRRRKLSQKPTNQVRDNITGPRRT